MTRFFPPTSFTDLIKSDEQWPSEEHGELFGGFC